jgi:hypothetical protein
VIIQISFTALTIVSLAKVQSPVAAANPVVAASPVEAARRGGRPKPVTIKIFVTALTIISLAKVQIAKV